MKHEECYLAGFPYSHRFCASEQEFVRSGILRGFLDFLKNDVFGVRDGHTLRFQQ